jgi:hypothetical protein
MLFFILGEFISCLLLSETSEILTQLRRSLHAMGLERVGEESAFARGNLQDLEANTQRLVEYRVNLEVSLKQG